MSRSALETTVFWWYYEGGEASGSDAEQIELINTASNKMWKSGRPNEIVKELHYNKPKIRKYK